LVPGTAWDATAKLMYLCENMRVSFLFLGLLFTSSIQGQNSTDLSEAEIMAVFDTRFEMHAPGEDFVTDGLTWEEAATNTKIMCQALPIPFSVVLRDTGVLEEKMGADFTLWEKRLEERNGLNCYWVTGLLKPPAGNPEFTEPLVVVMAFRSLGEKVVLNFNAAFPLSRKAQKLGAVLDSFDTVKIKSR